MRAGAWVSLTSSGLPQRAFVRPCNTSSSGLDQALVESTAKEVAVTSGGGWAAAGGGGAVLIDKVEQVLVVLPAVYLDKVCVHQVVELLPGQGLHPPG